MFAIRNLSVLAYANGFTLWHYKSEKDRLAEITKLGYFNEAEDMLTKGDIIIVTGSDGGTMRLITNTQTNSVSTSPLS